MLTSSKAGKPKRVALSFDDGPNPAITPRVLEALGRYGIKAAFFVCGANVKRCPCILKQIDKEGHIVGNHTYSHSFLLTLTGLALGETLKTQEMLRDILGKDMRFFRPPWGISNPFFIGRLKKMGFRIVPFDVIAYDWKKGVKAEDIVMRVKRYVKEGSIVLLHDGDETKEHADRMEVVKAIPGIVESLRALGYEFVRVDEILGERT